MPSFTNTIVLWSENKELVKITKEIAKQLGANVYKPAGVVDLLVIPCFIKIIDADYLKEMLDCLEEKNEVNEYFTFNDCKIIYSGKHTRIFRERVKGIADEAEVISKKYLLREIEKSFKLAQKVGKLSLTQFKSRAFRVVYIYHIIQKETYLCVDKIASDFNMTNRSINRDIETLLAIYPKLSISYTDFENNITDRRKARSTGKTIITVPETKLRVRIKRIINLYQILKNGDSIKVSETCKKYAIDQRTLRRDIEVLKDIDPAHRIGFDNRQGYYALKF